MKNIKGSRTEANLKTAFSGESQAHHRYFFFAAKAKEEGYAGIARYFESAAINEREHARLWFNYLGGIESTAENLKTAINGEHDESGVMYPSFAKTAREEGFDEIAKRFEQIGAIEKTHEAQYHKLLNSMGKDAPDPDTWRCDNCGNMLKAKAGPSICPVCSAADIAWSGYKIYKRVNE